jgi:hypothetical protein
MGQIHGDNKYHYVMDFNSIDGGIYGPDQDEASRKNMFSSNLFGDPEVPVWTDAPTSIVVVHNSTLPSSPSVFTVTVTSGGPLAEATVCLWKGTEIYMVDETNASGVASFSVSPATVGEMLVTVTKHNYIPYEGSATVEEAGDTEGPVVTVLQPNGGEVWDVESFFDIMWDATDNIGVTSIDILLSSDGGATYPHTIATGEANDGVFNWQVDADYTTGARVKVIAHDAAGNDGEDISNADFEIYDPLSGVITEVENPGRLVIAGATPNPFSERTSIRFGLPLDGRVTLEAYDVAGRQVALIAEGEYPAGYHSVEWKGADRVAGTGLYFLKLRSHNEDVSYKVVISK